ncbi:MAG: CoA transferase [Chloroflexi bacterium]|nr:CoA transferase [Chloroflexota bacterium]
MVNPSPTTPAALDGLRVLELAGMVAAPFCGKLLAALGADVLKIEPPKTGDPSRRRGPFPGDVPHIERSGTFLYLNTGKRSLTLNVDDPQGRVILGELAAQSDVLIHDIQPRRAAELGLDWETLSQINRDLIVAAITPYGSSGPNANHRAYDINVFHAAGEGNLLPNGLALDQFPDRAPITAGSSMGSYQGGITAAVGIAGAVFAKMGGHPGQSVDCSIQEAQLAIGYLPIQRLEAEGFVETRFTRFFRVGGVMPAEDGYVELLTLEPRQWESLGEFLGSPEWAAPEKFQDPATHGAEINRNVRDWTASRPKDWLYHQGQAQGVPLAPYYTPKEVFENPHQRDRGYFVTLDHPEAGSYEYAGLPFRMGETPPSLVRAPLLGEHNIQVLDRLGYTPEDMVMLARAGVI